MKKIVLMALMILGIIVVCLLGYGIITYSQLSMVSKGEIIPKYSSSKSALLVIDIQEGTTGSHSLLPRYKNQAKQFIENVNKVIQKADFFNIPVIYIYHENTNFLFNLVSGGIMKKDSPGSDIDSRIHILSQHWFPKHKMDAFSNPELDIFLRKNQINHLYITGLDAAFCVDRTIKAALNRHYKITYITDAVISQKNENKQKIINGYTDKKIMLTNVKKIMTTALK